MINICFIRWWVSWGQGPLVVVFADHVSPYAGHMAWYLGCSIVICWIDECRCYILLDGKPVGTDKAEVRPVRKTDKANFWNCANKTIENMLLIHNFSQIVAFWGIVGKN